MTASTRPNVCAAAAAGAACAPHTAGGEWTNWWRTRVAPVLDMGASMVLRRHGIRQSLVSTRSLRELAVALPPMLQEHVSRDAAAAHLLFRYGAVWYSFGAHHAHGPFSDVMQLQPSGRYAVCKDVVRTRAARVVPGAMSVPLIYPSRVDGDALFGVFTVVLADPHRYLTARQARAVWELFGYALVSHACVMHLEFEAGIYRSIVADSFPNSKHTDVVTAAITNALQRNPEHTDAAGRHNSGAATVSAATQHPNVTVLFTDICNYTKMCAENHMATLTKLSSFYDSVDELVSFHGLQKIETIGDCCMVASGLKNEDDHAARIIRFALALVEVAKQHKIQVRVGISTGPVVSGVMGRIRVRYFVFGDTVNTASRMESTSVPYGIKISSFTYQHIDGAASDEWRWERLRHVVKGKGPMDAYLLKYARLGRECKDIMRLMLVTEFFKPPKSAAELELFLSVLQNMMADAPYHNIAHVLDTLLFVEELRDAYAPAIAPDARRVFDYAALAMLLHDIGHPGFLHPDRLYDFLRSNGYTTLETFHAALASDLLQDYRIEADIRIVKQVIEATSLATHSACMASFSEQLRPLAASSDFDINHVMLICKCADLSHFTTSRARHVERACALNHELGNMPAATQSQGAFVRSMAKGQIEFINSFVITLFAECARVFPCKQTERYAETIRKNLRSWHFVSKRSTTMAELAREACDDESP